MAVYWIPGVGYRDDADYEIPQYGEIRMPNGEVVSWGDQGVRRLPELWNTYQFPESEGGSSRFQWEPGAPIPAMAYTPSGYVGELLQLADKAEAAQLSELERWKWEDMRTQALAIPQRELSRLTSLAVTPGAGQDWRVGAGWGGAEEGADTAWLLGPSSPDLGAIMLGLRDKIRAGTATPDERQMFEGVKAADEGLHYRASVPQPSDAFNPLSNEFFMALGATGGAVGGAGAFGAFAPVAGAAGGAAASAAVPSILGISTSTLGTIGAIGSYGGTGAGLLGAVTGQPWLQKLGLGLGIAGGLAGGLAGLGNLASTGIRNVGDVARLAGSAGKITGALGRASGVQPLQQAGRYLGFGSQVGQLGGGVAGFLGAAQGVQAGATQALTDTGGGMANGDFGYEDFLGWGDPYGPGSSGDFEQAYGDFLSWDDPYGPGSSGDVGFTESAGGGGWLGGLGSVLGGIGGFLAKNPGLVGAGVSALGSLGSGAIGANAASDAARLQAAALNRGIDLQTAQWLQTQANQAPWLEAGRGALGQLQGLAGQGQPTLGQVAPLSGAGYALPSATPGWTPSTYGGYTPTDVPSAAGYRWTPGQGPRAQDYRYTPGAIPAASQYRYTPGAVPTLSGQELLANDPGVQFRLDRARNALEGSAAARGSALSGPALAALQTQGQELASQEYMNAWQRAAQQAQMREGWAQQASQMGFGQAMSEAQLREQVNQIASQQGWSQAQAEAVFREQMAQQASSQNWGQAAQEAQLRAQQQQFGWQAGLTAQQQAQRERQAYDEALYGRQLQQNQLQYGRDWQQREAEQQRLMEAYNAQRLGQSTGWNQWASLAGLGQTSLGKLGQLGGQYGQQMANLYGQLGTAQAGGQLGQGQAYLSALGGLGNAANQWAGNQQFLNLIGSLNA